MRAEFAAKLTIVIYTLSIFARCFARLIIVRCSLTVNCALSTVIGGVVLVEFMIHGGRKLRLGFTTGTCAAIAAGAAAEQLLSGEAPSLYRITTPSGREVTAEVVLADGGCAVRKDGGDDVDATDGALICARVTKTASGFSIIGGEGIGKVTKTGLDQPVGEWAINSVPRRMIREQLERAAEKHEYSGGLCAEIFVPNGAEIAKRTYNPRMGIVGGISILGTSGIVEPMSTAALVQTVRIEARSVRAEGRTALPLTLGNFGEQFVRDKLPFSSENCVTCSNYIGEALDIALELGFSSVLIIGHLGKLVKLGAGIMNTHSAHADGRMDVLITCGVLAGIPSEVLAPLIGCATVDAALDLIPEEKRGAVLDILVQRAEEYLNARVRGGIEIGAVMFSDKHGIILKTSKADSIIERIAEECHG